MKIVILQDRLRLGGTESQALALGGQWADAGHEVRLVTFRRGGELAQTPMARRLRPIVLQPFDFGLDGWAPRLGATVVSLKPDVIVAFGREANAKLPRLAKLSPQPVLVATLRSGRDQPPRFWRALRRAHVVMANAQWTAQAAKEKGISPERIQVVYSGLARDPLVADPAAARAEWRKRAHTPEGAVVLLCVAGFRRGKGQDLFLRAAAQLPPEPSWQIWFAGDGVWLDSCKKLAQQLRLQDKVRFAGLVNDPAPLYAAADVAVLTSHAEALPNFLIEAQMAGLPVVATAVGGVPECFEDGRTGLAVSPGDPRALVAALTRAVRDQAWRAAARAPARDYARERFDATRNAARWLEIFRELS